MIEFVYDKSVAVFVGDALETHFSAPYSAIGMKRNGVLVAGAIFNCWTGADVEVTVAARPGGITRGFIRACYHYVFTQLQCERVSVTTEQPIVINLAERLGAQTEGRKRNLFGKGRDGVVLGLLREEFKL